MRTWYSRIRTEDMKRRQLLRIKAKRKRESGQGDKTDILGQRMQFMKIEAEEE